MSGAPPAARAVWIAAAALLGTWMTAAGPVRGAGAEPTAPRELQAPLKIGIIGTGEIGGTLAKLWVKAGHQVLVSSRHPDRLRGLATARWPWMRAR